MGDSPPVDVSPRISYSVWPGPEVLNEMPGICCAAARKSVMPRAWSSSPVSTVMLTGVFCTVDGRFSAVIVTVRISSAALAAVEGGVATPWPQAVPASSVQQQAAARATAVGVRSKTFWTGMVFSCCRGAKWGSGVGAQRPGSAFNSYFMIRPCGLLRSRSSA